MHSRRPAGDDAAFSMVELLVVLVIIGILAAIAIPRFLEQRQNARDAMASADLRNLVAIQTGLEASTGLSDDPVVIADEGWEESDPQIVACAALAGDDITLTVWHLTGSLSYSWRRSTSQLQATPLPASQTDCSGLGVQVDQP